MPDAVVLEFRSKAKPHGRASADSDDASTGRAARATRRSAVTPPAWAVLVARTADHHSSGMRSRRRHFETMERVAPMSDTAASIEAQRSITALNEAGAVGVSDMESLLGQFGLDDKAIMARDCGEEGGETGAMGQRLTETEQKKKFIARVKEARLARFPKQDPICTILGIEQGVYKHYEARTPLPHRFIPKFVAATGVDYEWLLAGTGKGPVAAVPPREQKKRTGKAATNKVA